MSANEWFALSCYGIILLVLAPIGLYWARKERKANKDASRRPKDS